MSSASAFGSWESPITAELIAGSAVRLGGLRLDELGNRAYWVEGRAAEGGRSAITGLDASLPASPDAVRDMTPASVNSRTRVHEYGGASFYAVGGNGDLITCDFASQGLKLVRNGMEGTVHDLVVNETAAKYRFADFVMDPSTRGDGPRLCFSVREDHTVDEPSAVVNTIVCFPVLAIDGSPVVTTPETHAILVNRPGDPNVMMSNPRVDPTGQYLSWVQWSHPNMPWDNTEVFVAKLASDGLSLASDPVCIAGGIGESVMEPVWWSPPEDRNDRYLLFLSDRSDGWWNIHRAHIGEASLEHPVEVDCVLKCTGYEFGNSAWQFGYQHFDFLPCGDLVTAWKDARGVAGIIRLDPRQTVSINTSDDLEAVNSANSSAGFFMAALPQSEITSIAGIAADKMGSIFLMGGGPTVPDSVLKWEALAGQGSPFSRSSGHETGPLISVRKSINLEVDAAYLSTPEVIEFPTVCNAIECTAFGIFYPPTNPRFEGPAGALPPLLVKLHGGPTGKASTVCRLDIQFFTSRGFAVLDVDYGGSSGYGREYRNRLQGNWGVVDVDDCCRGAAFLGEKGLVDSAKLAIQGGSAGGYTALASVAFRNVFHAATSSYGIGDLEALLRETHKFESRYMDGLVGTYPASKPVYESRCPVRYVENIKCPILFLHGKEDPVCPPNQATDMYAQLVTKGVPTCLILFDGESHGWRKAETICAALAAEMNFYGRVFGFSPDKLMELDIVGL